MDSVLSYEQCLTFDEFQFAPHEARRFLNKLCSFEKKDVYPAKTQKIDLIDYLYFSHHTCSEVKEALDHIDRDDIIERLFAPCNSTQKNQTYQSKNPDAKKVSLLLSTDKKVPI